MTMQGLNVGVALTGSFCTFEAIIEQIKHLKEEGANVIPIFSFHSQKINSRFGEAETFIKTITEITGNEPVFTIEDAEPLGPQNRMDILIIAPCTGNSLAKFSNGITDTPALMAAKGHIRNGKPLVIFLSTNDALGINLKNIGSLLNLKYIYFVPFGQDSYKRKPTSMVSDLNLIIPTLKAALEGRQLQPIVIAPKE